MCGRFTLRTPAAILADFFGLTDLPSLEPRYNIAPSQPVGVVRQGDDERRWGTASWGLVPAWARDRGIGNRLINARCETVAEKPAFRGAFAQRRCLIPADGFYEWKRLGRGRKQPYFITLADQAPFAFAGLWERWRDRDGGQTLVSCALITTTPNQLLATIHDRMPVILDREAAAEWLRPDAVPGALGVLLQPFPAGAMHAVPVTSSVNRPDNDDPACVEPVRPAAEELRLF